MDDKKHFSIWYFIAVAVIVLGTRKQCASAPDPARVRSRVVVPHCHRSAVEVSYLQCLQLELYHPRAQR